MIINVVNYLCCNLYCIVLLLRYAQYLILEAVALEFLYLYCIVSLFCLWVIYIYIYTFIYIYIYIYISLMSKRCMTEFVDLQNDRYVCMYV